MAVSMYQSNYRADFMVSDANISQRVEHTVKEQQQFAKILNDFDKSEKALVAEDKAVSQFTVESVKPEQATLTQTETSTIVPDDPMKLARMILKGEVDIEDVPAENLTYELLKAIIILKKSGELEKDESEEDEEEKDGEPERDSLFDPVQAAMLQQDFSASIQDMLLMEIYSFLEKHNERENEDKVTILDGISEPLPEYPETADTLSFPIENEVKDIAEGSIFAQIIEEHVEAVQEEHIRENKDTFERTGEISAEVLKGTAEDANTAKLLEQALKNGEIEEPTVTVTKAPEKTEPNADALKQSAKQTAEVSSEPKTAPTDAKSDKQRALNEELEMLRAAKLGKSDKQNEPKPANVTRPLSADTPIVFTAKDGSEIRVTPRNVLNQVTKLVEEAVSENKENSEYSLTLNPEELGKITVKLSKAADGAVSVTIMAENARTQRLLEQHSELMQSNLKNNGIQLESWQTVSESQQETLAQDYNGSSKNPYYRDDKKNSDEEEDGKSFAEIIAAM